MTKLRLAWVLFLGGVIVFIGLSIALLNSGGGVWAALLGNSW